ncbi:MAG: hypothetical protein NTV21_15380 [Planctomycetota bacterium]|nr:hypothetical protein [Planctomycetota bacterium]
MREELELQLAEGNASPEEAARLRARLEERIAGPKAKERPAPGSRPGGGTRSAEEREANLRTQLEEQLKESNATPEQAANSRNRLEERIVKMREELAAKEAAEKPATPASAPKEPEAKPATGDKPVAKPAEEKPVAPAPEAGKPAEPVPAESPAETRARNLREALEQQLKDTNASPAEAEAARARLEKRLADMAAKEKGDAAGKAGKGGKRKKPDDGR